MAIVVNQANKVLDNLFGGTSMPTTGTLYVGLSTTALNTNGTGYTEPSGAGYARVSVTNSKQNFNQASNGTVTNQQTITFPESQASWGTIQYVFIADASSGGNVLYYDALTTPRTVASLTTLLFQPGTLQISLS